MPDWERDSASKTTSHAKGETSLASSSAAVQPTEAARASERKDSLPTFCSCQCRCACDFRLQNPRRCGVLAAHGWAPAFSTLGAENCGSFFGQRGNLEVRVSLLSRDALRGKASSQRAHASRSAGPSTMLPSASKKASIAGSSPMLSHSSIRCHRPRTLTTSMADTLGPDARRSEALQKVRVAAVDAPADDAVVGAAVIATKGR
mmetsp:Transcript_32418/g.96807  ORF Transcript_32418/g.96807 Transcript_32418/m.96807 type:complete len:204 (-) Transcript_32418:76-687(-)